MAGPQRKCANCRYFQDAEMAGNGWCTHPDRQLNSDAKLLVRAGELACRNTWGTDLFESKSDDPPTTAPRIPIDPGGDQDDQVTSVVTPPEPRPDSVEAEEDRVVSDRPSRPSRHDDHNDAARIEQDERARIMARGNREALMYARERHSNRRATSAGTPPAAADSDVETSRQVSSDARVTTHRARFSDRFLSPQPPTDRRAAESPVPRTEINRRRGDQQPDTRFNSVPTVDPDFDLPGLREQLASPVDDDTHAPDAQQLSEPPATMDDDGLTSYERVIQRARRTRETRQRQASMPLRHADLHLDRVVGFTASQEDTATAWHPDERDDSQGAEPQSLEVDYDDAVDFDDGEYDAVDVDAIIDASPIDRKVWKRGWLSSLGFRGRATSTLSYDDAVATRHAGEMDAWSGERQHDDEAEYWQGDADFIEQSTEYAYEDASVGTAEWAEPPAPVPAGERYAPVQNTWEPLPDIDFETSSQVHPDRRESLQETAHDNFAGEPWNSDAPVADIPVEVAPEPEHRPQARASIRHEPWHRPHVTSSLPDLDDNLFDTTPRRSRTIAATDRLVADPAPSADSPGAETARASYFRAARFQEWAEHHEPERLGSHAGTIDQPRIPDRLPELEDGRFDLTEIVARSGDVLDMTIDIAPTIPRECRTCRSFRSADGGARGWCTNEWAFTHRRMVNEDDLACDATIGCWWLPADRYLVVEDEDGYAAPTPHMDEMIARLSDAPVRRISGA